MGMSGPCERQPWGASHGSAKPQPGLGLSSAASPKEKKVIRLRDIYDPRPQTAKSPVRIRPPGPPPPKKPPGGAMATGASAFASEGPRGLTLGAPPPAMRARSRSLSLPSQRGRSPVHRGPQVRFLDSMGLELEQVRVFKACEDPLIPPHVTCRLLMSSELAFGRAPELSLPYFKPCFCDNMALQPGFALRLEGQKVSLGAVLCSDAGISGTAHVLNLAFEKEVTLSYSFTNWRTHTSTAALWVSSERLGEGTDTDVFRFRLPVPPFILQPGAVLEFAICYRVKGCTYWDNNDQQNYKLSCHSYKLTVPKECEDSMLHFI